MAARDKKYPVMPSSHRLGDKKIYQYAGNPSARHGSVSRGSHPPSSSALSTANSSRTSVASGSAEHDPTNLGSRPSRYDPSSTGRPFTSRKSRASSRYNPDPSPTSPVRRVSSEGLIASSRWSNSGTNLAASSRYNPQAPPTGSTGSHHSYYNSHFGRNRVSSGGEPNEVANANYVSRGSKWRESPSTGNFADHDNYVPTSTTVPTSKPFSHKKYYHYSYHHGNYVPSYSSRYSNKFGKSDRQNSDSGYESSEGSKITESQNEHSLGSSLINSVAQTTRKVEALAATGHQRINLQKNSDSDELRSETEGAPESNGDTDNSPLEPNRKPVPMDNQKGIVQTNELEQKTSDMDNHNVLTEAEKQGEQVDKIQPTDQTIMNEGEKDGSAMDKALENVDSFKHNPTINPKDDVTSNAKIISKSPVSTGGTSIASRSHIPADDILYHIKGYKEPLKKIEACIFPMTEPETKLWELKNQTRQQIIAKQFYLLKKPVRNLKEYPFMSENFLIHEQAIKPILLKSISKIKRYEYLRKLQLRSDFLQYDKQWDRKCQKMDEISKNIRMDEVEEQERLQKEQKQKEQEEHDKQALQGRTNSRRRNRADFVDDAEIENVLLQIDPDYKHHQLAARIPPMYISPVDKYSIRYQNVNNLVTDKDAWAKRILLDGIDTFTEREHDLFVDAYLSYPKRFGKISQQMGGLRTPEECVLHYYRTKKQTNYKQLIVEKNKRRKANANRRRKEKEKEKEKERIKDKDSESEKESGREKDRMTESADLSVDENERTVDEVEDETVNQDTSLRSNEGMKQVEIKPTVQAEVPMIVDEEQDLTSVQELANNNEAVYDRKPSEVAGPSQREDLESLESRKRKLQEIEEVTSELPNLQPIAPAMNFNDKDIGMSSGEKLVVRPDGIDKAQQAKKKAKHNDGHHKSSYWSVKETNAFPELLRQYGSQWALISEKLGTKSTTMVRNYFQRNAGQMGWQSLVNGSSMTKDSKDQSVNEEKVATIHATETVPPQQKPLVNFFGQAQTSPGTPTHNMPLENADSFSQQSTPQGLPPPHLPSIQFYSSDQSNKKPPIVSTSSETATKQFEVTSDHSDQHPTVHFAQEVVHHTSGTSSSVSSQAPDSSRRSSIKSLLNNDEEKIDANAKQAPSAINSTQARDSQPSKVIVQELQSSTFSSSSTPSPSINAQKRPNFLSTILNTGMKSHDEQHQTPNDTLTTSRAGPVSAPGPMSSLTSDARTLPNLAQPNFYSTTVPPRSAPVRPTEINFANDPLAALAAVASAPEALASLLPASNEEPKSNIDGLGKPQR